MQVPELDNNRWVFDGSIACLSSHCGFGTTLAFNVFECQSPLWLLVFLQTLDKILVVMSRGLHTVHIHFGLLIYVTDTFSERFAPKDSNL